MTRPGAGVHGGGAFAPGYPVRAEVFATPRRRGAAILAHEALGGAPQAGAAAMAHAKENCRTMSAPPSQIIAPAWAVRCTHCTLCRARPGRACTRKGDHLARWLGACSAGRITRGDLRDVIVRLVVVTTWCVVTEERAAVNRQEHDR